MEDLFARLNSEQLESVQTTEGPVRLIAGAGTGKTKALISRYCYLVQELGISPKNILCVTFTNRAAAEMKARIRKVLGDNDLGLICTFHAFCTMLLHEDAHVLNFPQNFIILDKEDWRSIMLRIFADMGLTLKETTVQQKIDEVLEAKKMQADTYINYIYKLNNEELKEKFQNPKVKLDRNQEIFLRFLYEQKKCFGLDFNDLINFATYILENFPQVREKWQEKMQYIMVDEFQDVSAKQFRIAEILSAKHKNLFIVGDSDQTIYSWRGSHVKMLLDFDKKFPGTKTIVLNKNYRSTPQILEVANALISKNTVRYPKDLIAIKADGKKPVYFHAAEEKKEAEWICKKIKKIVGGSSKKELSSIAVLYRAHYQSRFLEEAFIKNDIPYRILSGMEFYGRREIKDSICYLRMLTSADDISFYRTINTPSRKIGSKKIAAIKDFAEKNACPAYQALKSLLKEETGIFKGTGAAAYIQAIEQSRLLLEIKSRPKGVSFLGNVFQTLLDLSGYEAFLRTEADEDRLANLAEFKRSVNDAGFDDDASLEDFLNHIALFTDLDREEKAQTVKLMTIHAAKGMEFKTLFICGMNEGIFPSRKVQTLEDMEEERRIAYVAFTRAKDLLFISDSEGHTNDGLFKYPSRFILDANLENFDLEGKLDTSLLEQTKKLLDYDEKRLESMKTQFAKGDVVMHPAFGKGVISLVNTKAACYTIKFDSLSTERSIQFTAKLTKV